MRNFFLTNFENQSPENFNIIWNSYRENDNSLSLIKFINQNSKVYKKKLSRNFKLCMMEFAKIKDLKKKLFEINLNIHESNEN